ncbi:MAG: glycosyltransferase family 9 protein, partial [Nitrospinales bacterium]
MDRAIKKILVIRSATRILDKTLKLLKTEFPEASVTVLAPASVKENLLRDPLIDEVLSIRDNKRISVLNYGWANIKHLKARKFDMAVSLYNVEAGMGYSNIDFLSWASG